MDRWIITLFYLHGIISTEQDIIVHFRHWTAPSNLFHKNHSKKIILNCKHRDHLNKFRLKVFRILFFWFYIWYKQLHHGSNFDSHHRSKKAIADVHIQIVVSRSAHKMPFMSDTVFFLKQAAHRSSFFGSLMEVRQQLHVSNIIQMWL